MKVKKTPRRTCLGCRRVKPKKELLRLVATPDGRLVVDPGGKQNGRGAYVCPRRECLAKMERGGGLSRALRRSISAATWARLTADINKIIEEGDW